MSKGREMDRREMGEGRERDRSRDRRETGEEWEWDVRGMRTGWDRDG